MKKLITSIVLAGILIAAVAATAVAAGTSRGNNFTDADNNGVCDNAGTSCQYKKDNGVCERTRLQDGTGECRSKQSFTDVNGDGKCDNRTDRACPRNGTGKGNCNRRNGCRK